MAMLWENHKVIMGPLLWQCYGNAMVPYYGAITMAIPWECYGAMHSGIFKGLIQGIFKGLHTGIFKGLIIGY